MKQNPIACYLAILSFIVFYFVSKCGMIFFETFHISSVVVEYTREYDIVNESINFIM